MGIRKRKKFDRDEVTEALSRAGITGKAADAVLGELGDTASAERTKPSREKPTHSRGHGATQQVTPDFSLDSL